MPAAKTDNDQERVPLVVRVDADVADALNRWANEEDRSVAAQTRILLRGAIPDKYFNGR